MMRFSRTMMLAMAAVGIVVLVSLSASPMDMSTPKLTTKLTSYEISFPFCNSTLTVKDSLGWGGVIGGKFAHEPQDGGDIRVDVIVVGLYGRKLAVEPTWFDPLAWGGGGLFFAKAFPGNESVCVHSSLGKFACTQRFPCVGRNPMLGEKKALNQCHNLGELWKALQVTHALVRDQRNVHSNRDWFMFLDDDCRPCPGFGRQFAALRHWLALNGKAGRGVFMARVGSGSSGVLFPWAAFEEVNDFMKSVLMSGVDDVVTWRGEKRKYFASDHLMQSLLMSKQTLGGRYVVYREMLIDHVPDHLKKGEYATTQGWSSAAIKMRVEYSPQCGEMHVLPTPAEGGKAFDPACAGYGISPCDQPPPWEWKWGTYDPNSQDQVLALSNSSFVLGKALQSCDQVCKDRGMKCDIRHRFLLNDCRTSRRVFGIEDARCTIWSYAAAPFLDGKHLFLSPWKERSDGNIAEEHDLAGHWCAAVPAISSRRRLCFCFS